MSARLLAWLYGREIARRNSRYDRGINVAHFDRPVISVGNLSVGGTGKTPMTAHIVGVLTRAGRKPCIAMRGYKAVRGVSDEEAHLRERCGVPVVAQADRTAGLRALLASHPQIDAIVLDDGFQHRRIARDVDIVLIDASRERPDAKLLPAGRLREPFTSLARADAVVLTHAESASVDRLEALRAVVSKQNPDIAIAQAEHIWAGLMDDSGAEHPVAQLAGMRVLVVCAIGNPDAFIRQAREACGSIAHVVRLRDHDPYRARTVSHIARTAQDADAILTTEKDWVKLSRFDADLWPCPVFRPRLEVALDANFGDVERMVLDATKPAAGVRV